MTGHTQTVDLADAVPLECPPWCWRMHGIRDDADPVLGITASVGVALQKCLLARSEHFSVYLVREQLHPTCRSIWLRDREYVTFRTDQEPTQLSVENQWLLDEGDFEILAEDLAGFLDDEKQVLIRLALSRLNDVLAGRP